MFPAGSVPVSLTLTVKALCPWGGARELQPKMLQPKMLLSANTDRQTDRCEVSVPPDRKLFNEEGRGLG